MGDCIIVLRAQMFLHVYFCEDYFSLLHERVFKILISHGDKSYQWFIAIKTK